MSHRKLEPGVCPVCHQPDGRHSRACPKGRCQSCHRAPAVGGPWCCPCEARIMRERKAAIAERLERLGPKDDDEGL
jgi:hypothetical protein